MTDLTDEQLLAIFRNNPPEQGAGLATMLANLRAVIAADRAERAVSPDRARLAEEAKRCIYTLNGHTHAAEHCCSLVDSLASLPSPAEPQDWKLVPVEPTREMLDAAYDIDPALPWEHRRRLWSLMLAAAPSGGDHAE